MLQGICLQLYPYFDSLCKMQYFAPDKVHTVIAYQASRRFFHGNYILLCLLWFILISSFTVALPSYARWVYQQNIDVSKVFYGNFLNIAKKQCPPLTGVIFFKWFVISWMLLHCWAYNLIMHILTPHLYELTQKNLNYARLKTLALKSENGH